MILNPHKCMCYCWYVKSKFKLNKKCLCKVIVVGFNMGDFALVFFKSNLIRLILILFISSQLIHTNNSLRWAIWWKLLTFNKTHIVWVIILFFLRNYYKGLVFNYILLDKRSIKTTVPFKTVGPNYSNFKREPESKLGKRFP